MHVCIECLRKNGLHAAWCKFNTATPIHNATRPSAHQEGEGKVIFTRNDGRKVTFDNVRVDSIAPEPSVYGTVALEFFDKDGIVHVPFVESWTIEYRY